MHFNKRTIAAAVAAFSAVAESSPLGLRQSSPNANEQVKRALQKRAITGIACGLFSSADIVDTYKNSKNLSGKGGTGTIAAHTCNRMGCYNTSGVYVCNDQDQDVTVDVAEIGKVTGWIAATCSGDQGEGHHPISGRMDSDLGGIPYTINVGFCDSHDSTDISPTAYTYPGPDGAPKNHCGMPGDASECTFAQCDPDTIVVNTAEDVTCSEYLGPNYIGAGAIYTYSTQRSVGTTWNVGGWLGIDSGELSKASVQAGFAASYSQTTTVGDTSGISATCGSEGATGNWTCGMDIQPKCWQTSGTCHATYQGQDLGQLPYTVTMPQLKSANDQGVYTANICLCGNCPGADGEGAPKDLCNLDCQTCLEP